MDVFKEIMALLAELDLDLGFDLAPLAALVEKISALF